MVTLHECNSDRELKFTSDFPGRSIALILISCEHACEKIKSSVKRYSMRERVNALW